MKSYALVGIVTLVSLLLYVYMGVRVGQARTKFGVAAPSIHGHPDFERVFRVQANTLEWLPIYLVSLWLFALYWDSRVAAGLGVVWIVGRVLYMTGYSRNAIVHQGRLDPGVSLLQKPILEQDLAFRVRKILKET